MSEPVCVTNGCKNEARVTIITEQPKGVLISVDEQILDVEPGLIRDEALANSGDAWLALADGWLKQAASAASPPPAKSTIYFDNRQAPKAKTIYCTACAAELAASLVRSMADHDKEASAA